MEDVGDGDHSSNGSIPASAQDKAQLIIKDNGIIAGVNMAERIFDRIDSQIQFKRLVKDGQKVAYGEIAFTVEGSARNILKAERLVLNCMQRMSGIATKTHELNALIADTGTKLLDTRKTTPNFRMMEKWAVLIGGGVNHRYGLFDMVMLKDNHIDYAGGVTHAIENVQKYLKEKNLNLKIEVETRTLAEVKEALQATGIHRIMLDNMSVDMMTEAVKLINGKVETEASGGTTEKTIRAIAETGVNYISVGALTHSIRSLDMSLKAIPRISH